MGHHNKWSQQTLSKFLLFITVLTLTLTFSLLAGNEEKDMNDTTCNKNSRKKRAMQTISTDVSQDEEVEPESRRPQAKKWCNREKASVRKRKTTAVSVQGEHSFVLS